MCQGLDTGMSLPGAETWSTGPRTDQPPRSPIFPQLRGWTEFGNTLIRQPGPRILGVFPRVVPRCPKTTLGPSWATFVSSLGLLCADSSGRPGRESTDPEPHHVH